MFILSSASLFKLCPHQYQLHRKLSLLLFLRLFWFTTVSLNDATGGRCLVTLRILNYILNY